MNIRVAIISGLKQQRDYTAAILGQVEGLEVVYKGNSVTTHFRQLRRTNPDIILLTTGAPDAFHTDLNPRFPNVRNRLPRTKIMLRTELDRSHPFIQEAVRSGASVIDERIDFAKIAEAIPRVHSGEQLVLYAAKGHDLEVPQRGLGRKETR